VFDLDVRDVDCAFKLIRRDLAQRLRLTADGAMISTELVPGRRSRGARIGEFGVHHRAAAAGRQSGADPAVVIGAFRSYDGSVRSSRRPGPPRAPSPTEPPHPAAA
jgi:hypothetical protein